MRGAEAVTVLSIQRPSTGTTGGPAPHLDIAGHLRLHGIDARYERKLLDDLGVVDYVLNRAADLGADLTVIGGCAPRGFPHLLRSGMTRDLLRSMTTPLLLSH
jgi:nucleotide-binding universal stress UspA family protein